MTAFQAETRAVSKARREAVIKAQDGICKRSYCEAPAVDVDHILPLWSGGSNANDNLEALCVDCHKQKTAAEAKARGKVKRLTGETGANRVRKPIQSRGFGSVSRGFDGKVKITKKAARTQAANDGSEQAREDFEDSGSIPARRAHRDLMKLLEEDDRRRSAKDTPQ